MRQDYGPHWPGEMALTHPLGLRACLHVFAHADATEKPEPALSPRDAR